MEDLKMKITSTLTITLLFLISFMVACGGITEPPWINKLPYKADVIEGVGASTFVNPVTAREAAATAARQELARTLSITVQNLIKTWTQEHQDFFAADESAGSSMSYYESVGRAIVNITVVGSQIDEFWVHPKTNITYARASISRTKAIEEIIKSANEIARREKTRFVEGKVNEAMKELDEALKKLEPDYSYRNKVIQ